jgi:methyl-accepting chemotaxis protein
MHKLSEIFGSIRMTTAILALVMISIIGSILAVSGSIYLNLHKQAIEESKDRQSANLAVAATILERRIPGSVQEWTADGKMASFQSFAIPPLYTTEVID